MGPMMLSNNSENDVLELEDKESLEDAVTECFSLVQSMHAYIDDTRKSALGIVINRASFLMMVFHLMEMKPLLEQLIKEPEFLRTHPMWPPLQHLADTLRDLNSFTHGCLSRSRIFLLYCSNVLVNEMNSHFNQLSLCLSAMLASATDLPLELKNSIQMLQQKFISPNILQEPGYSNLATEISSCLDDSSCDESHATRLLQRIADHLQVPEFEAAELKQELQNDLEKAESGRLESTGTLQALNQLFSSAQVLDERRRLASVDSPLFAGITSIPSSFFCPITMSLMREPVMIAEEGYTYEKSAILEWFERGHKTCPDTGKELQSLVLVPNLKLQQAMDEFFDHMYQAQMVSVLQVLRNRGKGMPVDQAVQTMKRLTDLGPKYRQLVFSLDGVEPLVGLLKPSAPHIREVVIKILLDISAAGDAHKVMIIEAGAVPVLLGLLRKNPAEKGGLTQLLCELSKVQDGKKAIVSEKGSMLVIATIFNSSPANNRSHVRILVDNLCKDDTLMIIEAARSTILEPLVSILTCGDEKIKLEIVTAVLSSFELNEFSSVALVNAGIVPPLLSMLQDGSAQSIQAAVKVLSQLSCTEQNKMLIAKAGAIPVLVKFLGYPLDGVKVDVTSILSNLATDSQNAYEIDSEGAVIRLFAMMKSKDTVLQEYSLKTLSFMAKDSQTVRNRVVELGMIPSFYIFLQSQRLSTTTCQRSILNILYHISKDSQNLRAVTPSAEGVKYLIGLLEGNAIIDEKEAVFGILETLLHAEEVKSVMLSDEKLLMLSAGCLQQGNSKIQESAAGLLSKFANFGLKETSIQMALARHRVLSAFIVLIDDQSSTEQAKQYAAETLSLFSSCTPSLTARQSVLQICLARMGLKKFKACRVHSGKCSTRETFCLIEAGAVPSLVDLIRKGGVHSAEWAVKALYTLVDSNENTQKGVDFLMKNNILVPLVTLVGKDQSSTETAVKMLEKIFRVKKYRDAKYSSVAKSVLMTTMAAGNPDVQKLAAVALMHLGMIPTDTSYMATLSS